MLEDILELFYQKLLPLIGRINIKDSADFPTTDLFNLLDYRVECIHGFISVENICQILDFRSPL
jgi:hypothetical protein